MGRRLGRAEFSNIGAAGKASAGTDQHDCLDARIGIRALEPAYQRLAQFVPETVNRRIVELEDGDAARASILSLFISGP